MKYGIKGYEYNEVIKNFNEGNNKIEVFMLDGSIKTYPIDSKEDIKNKQREQSIDFSSNYESYTLSLIFSMLLIVLTIIIVLMRLSIIAFDVALKNLGLIGIFPWLLGMYATFHPIIKVCNKKLVKIYKPKIEKAEEKGKHGTYLKYEKEYEKSEVSLNNIDNYSIEELIEIKEKLLQQSSEIVVEQNELGKPKVKKLTNNNKLR